MLQDLARVFSSNGVLIPGSEAVPAYARPGAASGACDHKGADCRCFGPKFDQASSKLELSRRGRERQAAGAAESRGGAAPGGQTGAGTPSAISSSGTAAGDPAVASGGAGASAASAETVSSDAGDGAGPGAQGTPAGASGALGAASNPAASAASGESQGRDPAGGARPEDRNGKSARAAKDLGADGKPLTPEQEKQVRDLEKRDRQVKAHEAAHEAAAGGQARGGAAFEYQSGPDGKRYAVGGHVDIDVSPARGNPQATLEKARTAQRAALAPSDPSGQDRAVAAAAAQMAAQAEKEIARGKDSQGGTGSPDGQGRPAGADANAPAADPRLRAYARPRAAGASLSVYA